MLTLEEIGQSVRNNIQLIIDSYGLPLAVGPISDDDYKILAGGFGELEWDFGLSQYGNSPDKYEFCIKLAHQGKEHTPPAGAALCIYDTTSSTFTIHMIENFERNDNSHPLKGRMVSVVLMSAFIFSMAVGGDLVSIPDPVPELLDYYASFGFSLMRDGSMVARRDELHGAFSRFAEDGKGG